MKYKEYQKYIRSKDWKDTRKEMLTIQPNCYKCGEQATDVHHISYKNLGKEKLDDLMSLCKRCHNRITRFKESPYKRFK